MLLSPLFYRYYCTWEFYAFPCSIQVTCVQVALLTGKCSDSMGLAVGVRFVCSPQGGSQHTLSECLVSLLLVIDLDLDLDLDYHLLPLGCRR
jgi:hypothetical protein